MLECVLASGTQYIRKHVNTAACDKLEYMQEHDRWFDCYGSLFREIAMHDCHGDLFRKVRLIATVISLERLGCLVSYGRWSL